MKKNLPDKSQHQPAKPNPQQVVTAQYQGPIPPPAYLEAYERTVPGAADRILTMAEKSLDLQKEQNDYFYDLAKSDRENEKIMLNLFSRGQTISSVIAMSGIALAAFGAYSQQSPAIFVGLLTTITPFLVKLLPPLKSKDDKS
jgi:uncharacterized membrane protein